jgi:hypothetical protein
MSEATRQYAWMLKKIATGIRKEWEKAPYCYELDRVLEDLSETDPDLMVGALWRFCAESTCLSPLEFKGKGVWWLNRFPRAAVALPPRIWPLTDEEREQQAEINRRGIAFAESELQRSKREREAAALSHPIPNDQETTDKGELT